MFLVEVADLPDDLRELSAGCGQFIFHPENSIAEFGSADELVVQQLPQPLVQDLRRNPRYESLELTRALHAAVNCRQNRRGPFAADHILQPAVRIPFA